METLTQDHAGHLLEALEDRYQASSTVVISQLPVKELYNMISNATGADALRPPRSDSPHFLIYPAKVSI